MRFIIFLSFAMGFFVPVQEPSLSEIRELYIKAAEEEDAGEKLLDLMKTYDETKPTLLGYRGASHMMMAKHVGNPFSKMKHFNKGKEFFTAAIDADPQNLEIRFLRFSVQSEVPSFLGYKDNLEEDKYFILNKLDAVKDKELKKMVQSYLSRSSSLSDSEKSRIK